MKPGGVGSANNPIKFMWHQVEILAMATGEILVAVNGKQTTMFKQAGRPKKGPIGLQAHAKASHQMYRVHLGRADADRAPPVTLK